jgi:hypothetical protein
MRLCVNSPAKELDQIECGFIRPVDIVEDSDRWTMLQLNKSCRKNRLPICV